MEMFRNNIAFVLPGLILLLSIPLVFGLVPPNRLYGVRLPKTYRSRELWYAGNRIGGSYLLIASCAALLLAFVFSWMGFTRGSTLGAVLVTEGAGVLATIIHVQMI